jgi:hypothetical protein
MKKKSSLNTCNEEPILKKSKKTRTTNNSQCLEYFNDISVQTQLTPPPLSLINPFLDDGKYEESYDFKESLSEISLEHKLNILNDVVLDNFGFEFELNLNKSEEKINYEEIKNDGCDGDNIVLAKDLDLNFSNLKKENIYLENLYFQRETEEDSFCVRDNLDSKDKKLREKLDKKMLTSMRRQMRQQRREEKTRVSKKLHGKTKSSLEVNKLLEQKSSSSCSSLTSDLDIFFDLNRFRKNKKIRHKKISKTKTNMTSSDVIINNKCSLVINSDLNELNHFKNANEKEMFLNIKTNDINLNEQTNDFDFDVQNFQINFDAL